MVGNGIDYRGNELFGYPVPALVNDVNYTGQVNGSYINSNSFYISTAEFNNDQKYKLLRKGISEMIEMIETNDEYKYPNLTQACNLFHCYLFTLTGLKDNLLPDKNGSFVENWVEIAYEFQIRCEEIFLNYVKEEYLLSFLPLVPKQLEYTAWKLKLIPEMSESEVDEFRNLFTLIALGFIGKLKLLSFCLSLTSVNCEGLGMDDINNYDQDYEQSSSCSTIPCQMSNCVNTESSTSCEGFYSNKYANYEFKVDPGNEDSNVLSDNGQFFEPESNEKKNFGLENFLKEALFEPMFNGTQTIAPEVECEESPVHSESRKRGRPRKRPM